MALNSGFQSTEEASETGVRRTRSQRAGSTINAFWFFSIAAIQGKRASKMALACRLSIGGNQSCRLVGLSLEGSVRSVERLEAVPVDMIVVGFARRKATPGCPLNALEEMIQCADLSSM